MVALVMSPPGSGDHFMGYQSFTKPLAPWHGALAASYETCRENENNTTQKLVPTHPSAPPSFRTRPVAVRYQSKSVDVRSFESQEILNNAPNDNSRSHGRSLEDSGRSQASRMYVRKLSDPDQLSPLRLT